MGRLIIRILAFPITAQALWRYGMAARFSSQTNREQILVELDTEKNELKVLVRTKLRVEQMSNLFWLVFAAVDSLVKEWFNLKAQTFIPCPHCLCDKTRLEEFHKFTFEECQRAAVNASDSHLHCPAGGQVRLDLAAPDLSMVHLFNHKVNFSDRQKYEPPIGEGGYATVYKGIFNGQAVAIKVLKNNTSDMQPTGDSEFDEHMEDVGSQEHLEQLEEFRHEVWIMSGLSHPNLVAMRGFCLEPPCIVTEYIGGGALDKYLQTKDKPLDWPLRLKIAKDIAKGCAFLHSISPPIMHRDLKSPNILLADVSPSAEVVAKVCDFGVSLSVANHTVGRRVDCPVWLAPEVMAGKIYTVKADVYSIGVILWELVTREFFFGEVRFMSQLEDMVLSGKRPAIPDDCPPLFKQLIEQCWHADPEKRPECKEIVARMGQLMESLCPEMSNYDARDEEPRGTKPNKQQESTSRTSRPIKHQGYTATGYLAITDTT